MKVLVTGASGFIGGHLVERLVARGDSVRVLVRPTSSRAVFDHLPVETIEGSLEDDESLRKAVSGMDVLFHVAGSINSPDEAGFLKANAQGTERLAQAVIDTATPLKRFILISSLAAGGPASSPQPIQESDPAQPVSAYGRSKLTAESLLARFLDRFPITILRPPIVYGPRDPAFFVVIKNAARGLAARVDSPTGPRLYSAIYIDDMVDALLKAASATLDRSPSGSVYYVSGPTIVSMPEIYSTIGTLLNRKVRSIPIPRALLRGAQRLVKGPARPIMERATRGLPVSLDKIHEIVPDYWICSGDLAQRQIDFTPQISFHDGMKVSLEWYQKAGWLK